MLTINTKKVKHFLFYLLLLSKVFVVQIINILKAKCTEGYNKH